MATYTTFTEETNFLGSVDCDHDPAGISTTYYFTERVQYSPVSLVADRYLLCSYGILFFKKKIRFLTEKTNIFSPSACVKEDPRDNTVRGPWRGSLC